MNKRKKSLSRRIKVLKRLYRLKKKKMITITTAYSAIAVMCFAILLSAGKDEPVDVRTADSDTSNYTEQLTDALTQAPTLTDGDIVRYNVYEKQHDFHQDYDGMWGYDMDTVEINMGTPDKYVSDYMVYKDIAFANCPADAVFYFKDNELVWASIKFHIDSRKAAISYFNGIQENLTNELGNPYQESSNFYDFTKTAYGLSLWEYSHTKACLELSNTYARFDEALSFYSSDYSYYPSIELLDSLINDTPEQSTENIYMPYEPHYDNRVYFYSNDNYGFYFGDDMTMTEINFGTPDEYGENQFIYKNAVYDIDYYVKYSAEAVFTFDDNGHLSVITFNIRSTGNNYPVTYNIKSTLTHAFGEPNTERRGYVTWTTPNSEIEMHGLTIAYSPN